MVAGTRTIRTKIDGDSAGLDRAARDSEKTLDRWQAGFAKFGKAVALGVAGAAVALVALGKQSVDAFVESEQAQVRLTDAYARFPKMANVGIEALREYNSELAKKVRFDDDALASGQAILAQFNLTGKQVKDITPLLADYAAKTGKDLPTAAGALGKAFLGNTKALKELGINYKSTGNQAQDIANITALLRKQVGGFAEAEGKTAAGRAEILKNQFGELEEQMGAALLPVLMSFSTWLLEVGIPAVERFTQWFAQNLGPLLAKLGAWFREEGLPVLRTFGQVLTGVVVPAISAVVTWLRDNWSWLSQVLIVVGSMMVAWKAYTVATNAWRLATEAATAAQVALNLAMRANPVGLIITLIAGLVAAFIILWNKSEGFRNFFIGAWEAIKNAARIAGQYIEDRWNALLDFFRGIPGFFRGIGEGISDGIKAGFKGAVNFLIDMLNGLIRAANVVINGVNSVNPFGRIPNIPQVPRLARGGLVTRSGLAMVGERGRELVTLPAGARVHSNRDTEAMVGGGAPEVHVYIGDRELTDIVRVEVREGNRAVNRGLLAGVGGAR